MRARLSSLILREWVIVIILSMLVCSALALAGGRQRNADLLNYHFYNGYALLGGRLDQDIAPAGPATYFNPALDVVHYLGYRHLPPIVLVALLGALQGLNVVLVWGIARRFLGKHGAVLPWLAALLAATGQNAVSLLGTPFGDNTLSILALAALLVLLGVESPGPRRLVVAGAVGGASVGLKLTMAAPHVGLAVLAGWTAWRQRRPFLLVLFALGSLAGWGVANGWWALELWLRFGNPLFPFLNDVFHSPFASPTWMADTRWTAQGAVDWLRPPLDAALGTQHRLQETPVQDPRLLLVFLAIVPWLLVRLRGRGGASSPERSPSWSAGDLAVYWLVTYGAWVAVFHYYRYATVLELLAPVVALGLLAEVWPRRIVGVAAAVVLVVLLATSVTRWAPDRGWRRHWFDPRLPAAVSEPGQLVVILDPATSFAAPFFPPETVFVGLAYGRWHGPAMGEAVAARLARHPGPLRALQREPTHSRALRAYGLRVVDGSCEVVRLGPTGGRLLLCSLERFAPPESGAQPAPARRTSSSTVTRQRGRRARRSALSSSTSG